MYMKVHAIPGARKERVTQDDPTTFTIQVKEPAKQNLANQRIRELLARELGVTTSQVTMLTGHRSSSKMFSIDTT